MNDFDPGPGWREWSYENPRRDSEQPLISWHQGSVHKSWVYEGPVPPLPTEPYTVIRVTWDSAFYGPTLILTERDDEPWQSIETVNAWSAQALTERITSFQVLSEPHVVTAKAVLDYARSTIDHDGNPDWAACEREFGVES